MRTRFNATFRTRAELFFVATLGILASILIPSWSVYADVTCAGSGTPFCKVSYSAPCTGFACTAWAQYSVDPAPLCAINQGNGQNIPVNSVKKLINPDITTWYTCNSSTNSDSDSCYCDNEVCSQLIYYQDAGCDVECTKIDRVFSYGINATGDACG